MDIECGMETIKMNTAQKEKIEHLLLNGNYVDCEDMLTKYRKINWGDRDHLFFECLLYLMEGKLDLAEIRAKEGTRKFPTSYEAYYYYGSVYQAKGQKLEALKCYYTSLFLMGYLNKIEDDLVQDMKIQIADLEDAVEKDLKRDITNKDKLNKIRAFNNRIESVWGKNEKAPRDTNALVVGKEYWVSDEDLRYVGVYRNPVPDFIGENNLSLVRTQAEFLKFNKKGNSYEISDQYDEYLLPIASSTDRNIHLFEEKGEKHFITQQFAKHFNYYRVKNNTKILSQEQSYYGNPIPLIHSKDRKKLVLSFFVDGLAQEVINGDDFKKLMPNTYHFFRKGTVCTQVYSCSEWTFPSLATYESGLNTLNHMMFHNTLDGELPLDVPTLSEYFKSKGYYTTKLDGDWRCIYSYGFARGVDQYIYHHQSMGARAEQEIINIIEHLETFKETDHYLWMTVGDLHDIADGLDLSLAVQKNLTLEEREYEEKGATSVKQNYSSKKMAMYKKTIQYFDMLFGILFSYIENNFNENDILISLFADHGQGYLVPDGHHFLSKERTKVAFMFRGNNVPCQFTDELISTADYLPIMCKLAGIDYNKEIIDGSLPEVFGGEKRKEYVITESLHPGDVYSAVANTSDYEIYFDNSEKTDDEGRFILGNYKVYGYDHDGKEIKDDAVLKKYEKIFLDRIAERIIYE